MTDLPPLPPLPPEPQPAWGPPKPPADADQTAAYPVAPPAWGQPPPPAQTGEQTVQAGGPPPAWGQPPPPIDAPAPPAWGQPAPPAWGPPPGPSQQAPPAWGAPQAPAQQAPPAWSSPQQQPQAYGQPPQYGQPPAYGQQPQYPGPQYGGGPGGYPGAPGYPYGGAPAETNSPSRALLWAWLTFVLGIIAGIPALIFGRRTLKEAKAGQTTRRGAGIFGVTMGILSILGTLVAVGVGIFIGVKGVPYSGSDLAASITQVEAGAEPSVVITNLHCPDTYRKADAVVTCTGSVNGDPAVFTVTFSDDSHYTVTHTP